MPYIAQHQRPKFQNAIDDICKKLDSPGEANYVITEILLGYLMTQKGKVSYTNVNELVGILECAKLELYRKLAAPYEDEKIKENGDVYP